MSSPPLKVRKIQSTDRGEPEKEVKTSSHECSPPIGPMGEMGKVDRGEHPSDAAKPQPSKSDIPRVGVFGEYMPRSSAHVPQPIESQGWGDAGTDNLLNVPWMPTSNWFEPSQNFAANSQYAGMWNPSSKVEAKKAPSSEKFRNTPAAMINNPLFHQPIASKQALFDQARIPNSLASSTDASLAAAGRGQPQYQGWGDAGTDNLLNVPWKPTSNWFEPSRNFATNSQYADMWNPSSKVEAEKARSSKKFRNTQAAMINNPLFHQPIASKHALFDQARISNSLASGTDASLAAAGREQPQSEEAQSSKKFCNTSAAMINNPLFHQSVAAKQALFDQARIPNSLASGTDASLAAAGRGQPQYQGWGDAGTGNLLNVSWKPTSNWFEPSRNFAANSQYADMWNPLSHVQAEKAQSSEQFGNTQAAMINNPLFHQPIASKQVLFDPARIPNSLASGTDASLAAAGRGQPQYQGWGDAGTDNLLNVPWMPTSNWFEPSRNFAANSQYVDMWNPSSHVQGKATSQKASSIPRPSSSSKCDGAGKPDANKIRPCDSNESQTRGSHFKGNQQVGSDVRGSISAPTSTVQNIQSASRVIACETYNENRHTDKEDISAKQLKSYCNELVKFLIKEAKGNCGVHQFFPNCEIRIARVQISQNTSWTDKIGHKTSREEIAKIFNQPPKSDIEVKELFEKAKKLATELVSRSQSFTDEYRNHYVETCGNFVAVVGQAGIGKTTLTKVLLDRVTSEDERWFGADYIFYLQFRDINFKEKTNFIRFLTKKITASWINNKSIRNAVLDRLAQSSRVCIIMDGFDEANLQYDIKSSEVVNLHDEATAKDFIRNLFCGNLFPKAKKLITSRPRQLYDLPQELHPLLIVTILGLDKDAQKQICEDLCSSNEDLVWNYIENHPDVSSYCFVPVNCILVMHCIHKFSQDHKTNCPIPTTLTSVFIVVLCLFSERAQVAKHFEFKLKSLEVFAKLAQKAFSENKYFFDEYDLETAGLTEEQLTTFLVTVPGKNNLSFFNGRSPKCTYFSHFLWQELFVAIELMIFGDLNDCKKMTYKDFTSDRFENVSKFLFGLCNTTTCGYLFEKFTQNPQIRNKLLANVTGQAKLLKSMTLTNLPDLSVLNKESFLDFLRICSWVNEMHDDEFANEFAEKINEHFLIEGGEILPSDVVGFHYVLRNRSSPLSISIGRGINFVGDSLTRFLKEFTKTIDSSLITMRKLDISGNYLEDDGVHSLSTCISRIEELDVAVCDFTAEGFKVLASKIKELSKPMRKLNISFNDLGYLGAHSLSTCISRIEELDVRHCGFTAEGFKVLASKIKELPKPMRMLHISWNPIGDDAAHSLSTCISRIEELHVERCGFTAEGFKALASKIKELPKPMRMLNISLNQVGDDLAHSLSTCISRIEELDAHDCGFTAEGYKALASKIKELPKPMRMLDISWNDLEDDAAHSLSTCISRIEELRVQGCRFTAEGFKALASKIKELPKPMRMLDISFNDLGYDAAHSLSTCISRIEELDVRHCGFTSEGFKALASKIKELPKPMERLVVGEFGRGMSHEEVKKIFSDVGDKLKSLEVRW